MPRDGASSKPIREAHWGILGDRKTAVIEMAQAAGLELLQTSQYNPLIATTYGVGELILHVFNRGFTRLWITLGGSATIDGGAGCLQALGVKLLDKQDRDLKLGGGAMRELERIDLSEIDPNLTQCEVLLLSDTTIPLGGPQGAAELYGAQKGANAEIIQLLDKALVRFGTKLSEACQQDILNLPGSGAAGGLGGALSAIFQTQPKSGIDIVLDALEIDKKIKECDAIISAEGKVDEQTVHGKALHGLAMRAKKWGKPLHIFAGKIEADPQQLAFTSLHQIAPVGTPLQKSITEARTYLYQCTLDFIKKYK